MRSAEELTAQPDSQTSAGAILTVDLGAIVENFRRLCAIAEGATCAAVVKADAYGLGVAEVAPVLRRAGCDTFFVATATEAIRLRELIADATIYVLHGLASGAPADFVAHALRPVLNSKEEVRAWARTATGPPLPGALHLDTGMSRLGIPERDFLDLVDGSEVRGIPIDLLMSHLACPDTPDHALNRKQLAAFGSCVEALRAAGIGSPRRSLAASYGIFLGPEYHFDLVRPGAALFGVAPLATGENPMRQVVRLQGRILQVRRVDPGMTVGYGATHHFTRPARLATVGVGYADGYPRALSGRGTAYLDDLPVPLVGRVSMDLITLDVTEAPEERAQPGCLVDLIGPHNPPDAIATAVGTVGYEILTSLAQGRYERRYLAAHPGALQDSFAA